MWVMRAAVATRGIARCARVGHIEIINEHDFAIDEARLRKCTAAVLDEVRCSEFDVGIMLTDDDAVRELNLQHRGIDAPTDILSFPFHDGAEPGAVPDAVSRDEDDSMNLGDLVISVPYVQRTCEADAQLVDDELRGVAAAMVDVMSVEERLPMLAIHGILHLLNYDHETDEEFDVMTRLEDQLLARLRRVE